MTTSFISRRALALLVSCSAAMIGSNALAAVTLKTPYVTEGELEIEYFLSRTNDDSQRHKTGVGYGVNDFWFVELEGDFRKSEGNHLRFNYLEVENKFQLTERGEYWLDVGANIGYEWTPRTNVADTLKGIFILAKDVGKTSHIVNFVGEKNVGSGPRDSLEGELLWSSRYRYSTYFEPGFEIFSEFGELKNTGSFNEQEHSIGPAAYGKIPLGLTKDHADGLKYRAGYLFGVSDAAADGDAFVQLEYELHF